MSLPDQLNAFARSVRYPSPQGAEDADTKRRMDIYRSLFFNNVNGFIQNGFPVLHSFYAEEEWERLVRQFFTEHQCTSPYFIHISQEFIEYLSNGYQLTEHDPVFLKEMAHYEWLELALSVREPQQPVTYWRQSGMPDTMMASPLSELAGYPYAVHKIGPDYQPDSPGGMHYYLLYRDPQHNVQFQHLSPLSALTMELLATQPTDFTTLAKALHEKVPDIDYDTLINGLQQVLSGWLQGGAVTAYDTDNSGVE
ncbi:HvfC family RiPP maturation protein [Alteromonas gilva]|uniref:DNA-binding domain-containing protein n=1 Tax=Alteromonas gilva TaxID=2987522 RepID=A0ABT5L442_9ALTE|nr:putative DNA-binding domain-containing protein [Alteromonas gilva]MDC8831814.1 putative DNA-binding domain-containing protein [Alteromonas gilva]